MVSPVKCHYGNLTLILRQTNKRLVNFQVSLLQTHGHLRKPYDLTRMRDSRVLTFFSSTQYNRERK